MQLSALWWHYYLQLYLYSLSLMYLNDFAHGLTPKDMTTSLEFAALLARADDLQIPHDPAIRYVSHQTVLGGIRFHFTEWGAVRNPPVVLLHGGNQSSHSWDLVSLHLALRYHVYALDQRGHGDSEWSRDIDYSMNTMVADVVTFLTDQRIEQPIVIGHSMGGLVALNATLTNPQLVRGLVIIDTGPEISIEEAEGIRDFITQNILFDDPGVYLDRIASYDPYRSKTEIARTLRYNLLVRADGKYAGKSDIRRYLVEPTGPNVPTHLTLHDVERIETPVLLVRGADSNILLADAAERFVNAAVSGRLATVPNVGHNVHEGNTEGFLEAIAPFMRSLS